MSSLQPSGYKFGCTYVGTKQFSPSEAYPVMMGELEPSGNMNANIIHQITKSLRCKFIAQIQNRKWVATQMSSEYRGKDYVASVTLGNPDLVNESGVVVSQYLQSVTKNLSLGAEVLYQYGPTVPGSQIAVYTLAGRWTGNNWQLSGALTPMAGGIHMCYYQKPNDVVQIGVELEGSLRTQECTATVGYQIELPKSNLAFRGQLDSNWCVGAVMEKKLPPLPFTFALSAFANHVKGAYRFGVGLVVG
jgi:mitochondrial import receptor subunit TOM40